MNANTVKTVIKTNTRRRRPRVLARPRATITNTVVRSAPSGRTLRNRRRRYRRSALRNLVPIGGGKYWENVEEEKQDTLLVAKGLANDQSDSIEKAIQTLLYPTTGIHRGIATGAELSALCYVKSSLDVQISSTQPYITFNFQPSFQTGSAMAGIRSNATLFSNPLVSVAGESTLIPGVFSSTNPSTNYRVVSFTLNIIPSGALLTQAGEGAITLCTDIASVNWSGGNAAARSMLDNFAMVKAWNGRQAMSIHWVPNEHDLEFDPSHTTDNPSTGIVGYFQLPASATAVGFRFEWAVGIEYLPNTSYRPYVTRLAPEIAPNTYYYVNKYVQSNWSSQFIIEYSEYEKLLKSYSPKFKGLVGGSAGFGAGIGSILQPAGSGGNFSAVTPADIGNVQHIEENVGENIVEQDNEEYYRRLKVEDPAMYQMVKEQQAVQNIESANFYQKAKAAACKTMEQISGYDVCGTPTTELIRNIATDAINPNTVRAATAYALGVPELMEGIPLDLPSIQDVKRYDQAAARKYHRNDQIGPQALMPNLDLGVLQPKEKFGLRANPAARR